MCFSCHVQDGKGVDFAPAFDGIGARLSRAELIRAILRPGETIAAGYQTLNITTKSSAEWTGLPEPTDGDAVALRTGDGKIHRFDKADIARMENINASSMPEGLAETMSPKEFVDLISFLASKKN